MGRTKQIQRKRGHSANAMKKAIELVQGGMSIRQASKECQLSYPTVRLYVKRTKDAGQLRRLTPNYEVNKIFTSEEELVKYIEYCANIFYGLTAKDCRRVAFQMAKVNGKENIPQTWFHAQMAGFEWLRGFRRHPEISLRKPEACSLARATAFNKHNVETFFKNLKSAMERHTSFADGTRLYNLDETSTTTVHRSGKVLARKGTNVAKVTSGERGTLVTTCCIISATGQALPPAMVFPRKNFKPHMLHGAPPGTLGLAAASGWMNADIFVDVMRHFIKHVSASKDNPALLLMDNHESHLSIEALELAKSSGVTILTLHPHTTAKLQPLDVGLNGPFKSYYNAAVDSWMLRNPGRPLTIYNVAECVGSAYLKAMTPVNIISAFKKCGIFPFDDCIFTEADFMPSTVTDRPLTTSTIQTEEGPDQNIALKSKQQEISEEDFVTTSNATTSQDNILLDSNDHIPPKVSVNQPGEPTPSTSKKHFLSPIEFMPPIKAKCRQLKRRRVLGRSIIATDTPEKEAIAEKKKKGNQKQINKIKQDLFNKKKMRKESTTINETSDEEEFIASGSSSGGEDFISENEDEDGGIILDGNFLPLPRDPKENDFVVVLFPLKITLVYYVAKILEIIEDNDVDTNFFVSFLRLKNRTHQTFCEPIVPDTAGIQMHDIKYILPVPKIIGSSRRQSSFSFDVHFDTSLLNLR